MSLKIETNITNKKNEKLSNLIITEDTIEKIKKIKPKTSKILFLQRFIHSNNEIQKIKKINIINK